MTNGRPFTISATAVTGCLRGVVFAKQGAIAPPLHPEIRERLDLFRTFAEVGQRIQSAVRTFWQSKGVLEQEEEWIPRTDAGFTGKFDAICRINGRPVVYEIKGSSKSFFAWVSAHRQPRPEHRVQVMLYHRLLAPSLPDLDARLLYVSRNAFTRDRTLRGVEVPITYTENDFQSVVAQAAAVRDALQGGDLPVPAPAIDTAWPDERRDVSLKAMMCRHHALCLDNENWYTDAQTELGRTPTSPDHDVPPPDRPN